MSRIAMTLSVALVLAASSSHTAAGQNSGQGPKMDLVAGTGQFAGFGFADLELHVNAKSGPGGEDPATGAAQGTFFVRYETSSPLDVDFRGRVTCLNVLGNRAIVGGEITAIRAGLPPTLKGFIADIIDNGEGNDDPPDEFNFNTLTMPPPRCFPFETEFLVMQGNFIVRDAGFGPS